MAAADTKANLVTYWKGKLDDVIHGEFDPPPPGPELEVSRRAVLDEQPMTVAPSTRVVKGPQVSAAITDQRSEVKGAFARRRDAGRPAEPGAMGNVKKATPFDNSKILKFEAEMKKRFEEKVSAPSKDIRPSRVAEMAASSMTDFCRGNELFDKHDYEASLAEYGEVVERVPPLEAFALINRGNAYKALEMPAEAMACYCDALDRCPLNTPPGRLLHSYVLNNLGAACQDQGRVEECLQHLSAAVSLNPRCYLALRNRANVHLQTAQRMARAEQPSLLPPQHELALGYYSKAMEVDWHLPVIFPGTSEEVIIRREERITSSREEPSESLTRNHVYHFTSNLTHSTSKHV